MNKCQNMTYDAVLYLGRKDPDDIQFSFISYATGLNAAALRMGGVDLVGGASSGALDV